jgi:hypothetical protein
VARAGGRLINGTYNTAWYLQGFRVADVVYGGGARRHRQPVRRCLGGLMIDRRRCQRLLIDAKWTQAVVFGMPILTLVFKPTACSAKPRRTA